MNQAAIGAATLAKQFHACALKLQSPARTPLDVLRQRVSVVAYYLLGHSIELALKSFLLARCIPNDKLRSRAFGHNLAALLAESRKRRLGIVAKLSDREARIIRLLNQMYEAKELEYRVTGRRTLPPYAELAERLCNGVHAHANAAG
jgi:hypothetical protein